MNKPSFQIIAALLVGALAAGQAHASAMSDANAAYKSGNYNSALSGYQQAVAQVTGLEQAKAFYKEGLTLHKLHRDPEAVTAYQQAQRIDPTASFASSPASFAHNLQVAQQDSGRSAAPAQSSGTRTVDTTTTTGTATTDPAAVALANSNVYISPSLAQSVNATPLEEAAQSNTDVPVKIAVLDALPPGYANPSAYGSALHTYLNLGKAGLVVVALHGRGSGAADFSGSLTASQEKAIADRHIAQIGGGNVTAGTAAMATDLAATASSTAQAPMHNFITIFFVVFFVILILIWSATRRKKAQIVAARGPLTEQKNAVLSGVEYLDNYIDVLPKNNADSDQVRAFRQAAAYKVDQADKIMSRSTELSDMQRAEGLLRQANGDVQNARQYLDRATGGTAKIAGDDAMRPIPFPSNQQQVAAVPEEERGVSFFSSQPAPISQLVPVTLTIDGQQKTVMATPQEAQMVRSGQMPPVRSFNVGGQNIPWYGYQNYDPYHDYWTYQNNGWRGIAGGAIAGFVGAELLNSLFSPRPYWGGGWYSPYAYGPGWDSWGGWGGYGGGGFDSGYLAGEREAHAQDYAFQDQNTAPLQDSNYAGANFMGAGAGPGYDTSDYGGGGSGAGFMGGGDRS